ncbi:hypothetical protein [Lichenifustis flavocetrariae]|uniref:Uncharacterized protein n=1 Tax=Lichenifustis flavocetrariae TaxID=2949735 RepID=A0AA41YSU3_9HYPH|nr:hypothetical protein [Lichenifustis flavocetrariae]MCW6506675.1 hypothetical protein [Lichenifustis flavocetrariae]
MTSLEPRRPVSTPDPQECEPEGFGDAVEAAALMLGLVTALAFVGFRWERNREEAAHTFAVELMERVARHGEHALVPVWSGAGKGPTSSSARHTFRALRGLGALVPTEAGACKVVTRFSVCSGTRFHCYVSGTTPVGPVEASIGLCDDGSGASYSFDTFDVTLPLMGADHGNRAEVDVSRDGMIRYGTTPLPPEALPVRLHRRAPMGPLRW